MRVAYTALLGSACLLAPISGAPIPENNLVTGESVVVNHVLQVRGIRKAIASLVHKGRDEDDSGIDWKTRTAKKDVLLETPEKHMLAIVKAGQPIPKGWKTPKGFVNT